jgi:putative nucleotidyltransferase with HDIG domain
MLPSTHTTSLVEILSALSHALDMTEGQPPGHCIRCCWIGILMAEELGLSESETSELYYTILLKDLGCSSNAARICELYLVDDRDFKSDFKRTNGSLPQALRFVLAHTGLKAGLAERFRAIVHILQNGGEIARDLIETRCQRGAEIARKMRFSEAVALGIKNLDEHWDGSGKPDGRAGDDIPFYAQVALLAQVVDVFHTTDGEEAAIHEILSRNGTWFSPNLVKVFERVSRRPTFWDSLKATDLEDIIYGLAPVEQKGAIDDAYLDDIAEGFAEVIDSKSSFTAGHSARVTVFADLIAAELGFTDERRRWLKRAALLHDIGKLGVSNTILDKPAKLDGQERALMQQHASHTETILQRITAFRELAPIASAHHERLDGTGYPKGLSGDQICLESRILAVADIFDALTADRPYRKAMSVVAAFEIMQKDVGTAIDSDCFAALQAGLLRTGLSAAA